MTIGKPVRQSIVYNGGQVLMVDELKKTGERLSPDDRSVKPLFLTLGMGKEASFDEMLKVFTITSTNKAKGRYNATFSPKQRAVTSRQLRGGCDRHARSPAPAAGPGGAQAQRSRGRSARD